MHEEHSLGLGTTIQVSLPPKPMPVSQDHSVIFHLVCFLSGHMTLPRFAALFQLEVDLILAPGLMIIEFYREVRESLSRLMRPESQASCVLYKCSNH